MKNTKLDDNENKVLDSLGESGRTPLGFSRETLSVTLGTLEEKGLVQRGERRGWKLTAQGVNQRGRS